MGNTRDKLKRRVRKTVKWGGAALTVLLVVVWIGSGWWVWAVEWRPGVWMSAWTGQVSFPFDLFASVPKNPVFTSERLPQFGFNWWFYFAPGGGAVPLWCPALLSLLATAAAWRADAKYMRRARAGLCAGCGYDRAGLAASAVCPECGAAGA